MLQVVAVGQTPPPYGGQAVMITNMLKGSYEDVNITHVRMAFSRKLSEGGRLSLRKVLHVLVVASKIGFARSRTGATVLYYPPAGAGGVAMYRDIAILLATRWMFQKTIFHFHAGGVSEAYDTLSCWLRPFYLRAYLRPDAAIRTSPLAPPDPERFHARREFVVLNGIEESSAPMSKDAVSCRRTETPVILFVGLLRESKGVFVLLEACRELKRRGVPFRLQLVGEFQSEATRARVAGCLREGGLQDVVEYCGVLVGEEKHRAYSGAAVLAFPTFFESETFGLVLIEAMQFSLPVVATRWRGIPAVVEDGFTGFLVPVKDSATLADRLAELLTDEELAKRLGRRGRGVYEQRYTLSRFHRELQNVFDSVRADAPS